MGANANSEGAASKPEGKTGDDDLSMEEILQSIRKIIADDDGDGKKSAMADNDKTNGIKTALPINGANDDVPGSDVLELTEMIEVDSPAVASAESAKPAAAEKPPVDILNQIDNALASEKPAESVAAKPVEAPVEKPVAKPIEKPAAAPAEKAVEKPVEKPMAKPVETPAAKTAPVSAMTREGLLSPEAASVASSAFKHLHAAANPELPDPVVTPVPGFRGGATIEDLVVEMLKPMMKAWLDTNLPPIVERIVEREVKKLTH